MEAALLVFQTLFPIYACLALGVFLRRGGLLKDEVSKGINSLMFHVCLPCLIVDSIANADLSGEWQLSTVALMLSTLSIFALSWIAAPLLGISKASRPTFCQSVFRSNNAYIGIPVMTFAFAGDPRLEQVSALAVITLAPSLILYNLLAVLILTKPGDQRSGLVRCANVLKGVSKNPLIRACVIGVALMLVRRYYNQSLPQYLFKTIKLVGNMATAGSLIALGASLTKERFMASFDKARWAAILKLFVTPAFGLLYVWLLGLGDIPRFVVVCYLACPSAVASYVMAQAMDGDSDLAGSAVAVSTVYSFFSLSLALMILT